MNLIREQLDGIEANMKSLEKDKAYWMKRAERAEAENAGLREAIMHFSIKVVPTAQLIQEFHPDTEDHSDIYKMAQHIIDDIGNLEEVLGGAT